MPYPRDRKIFHQFEFAPVTGPTGISTLESIGTRDIIVQKPDPEWLTLSATGFVALAATLDEEHKDNAHPSPNPLSVLNRHAGSALHRMRALMILVEETLPPDAPTTEAAWEDYRENLDTRLPKLLPTTSPVTVKHLRRTLEDPNLVFPRANDHPDWVETDYRYLAQKVLHEAEQGPPLEDTYPLPLAHAHDEQKPMNPDVLATLWSRVTIPQLRSQVDHLIRWHEGTPQILGRSLSKPTEGMINGLPELTAVIKVPSLRLTLPIRTDEATRWTDRHGRATLTITDLKSGTRVHIPPEGSQEETADRFVIYLLATTMASSIHPDQKGPGSVLEYRTDTSVDNPHVLCPEDNVSMPVVALGQYPPEIVDKAERYRSVLTDPIAAQAMLANTENLLDRIRERRRLKNRSSHRL